MPGELTVPTRICTRCGEAKRLDDFPGNGIGKPPRPECKACKRRALRAYDRAHPRERSPQALYEKRCSNQYRLALARGEVEEPTTCAAGDCTCKGRIEAHHQHYDFPLQVTGLCQSHHTRLHDYWDERAKKQLRLFRQHPLSTGVLAHFRAQAAKVRS